MCAASLGLSGCVPQTNEFEGVATVQNENTSHAEPAEEAPVSGLPQTPAEATALERQGRVPLGEFYQIDEQPREFGELIRSETTDDYNLVHDGTATRILYRSRDASGRPTTASAVVVVPPGEVPAGGWPIVVWAHGTTGVARQCGPSGEVELEYYSHELMTENFALVVVDYAGLSSEDTPHRYMDKATNALDIEGAVPAARSAVSNLSEKWVAIGHSQGGAAVWALGEHKAERPDPNYLGSIALAPAVGGPDLIEDNANNPHALFYPLYWAFATKAQFPDFDVSTMVTDEAMQAYQEITTNGCWYYAYAHAKNLEPGKVLKEGWQTQPAVREFMNSLQFGDRPVGGPLFIAVGREDYAVPEAIIESKAKAQCEAGGNILYRVYEGDHDSMMETSFDDQMKWISDQFAGVAQTPGCE